MSFISNSIDLINDKTFSDRRITTFDKNNNKSTPCRRSTPSKKRQTQAWWLEVNYAKECTQDEILKEFEQNKTD